MAHLLRAKALVCPEQKPLIEGHKGGWGISVVGFTQGGARKRYVLRLSEEEFQQILKVKARIERELGCSVTNA